MKQTTSCTIRDEAPGDEARISEVTELAFRSAAQTCEREHLLVEWLRAAGALTVSLVAVANGTIVGHAGRVSRRGLKHPRNLSTEINSPPLANDR